MRLVKIGPHIIDWDKVTRINLYGLEAKDDVHHTIYIHVGENDYLSLRDKEAIIFAKWLMKEKMEDASLGADTTTDV